MIIEALHIINIHSTTNKKRDEKIDSQVADFLPSVLRSLTAARGYDAKAFREKFRENDI